MSENLFQSIEILHIKLRGEFYNNLYVLQKVKMIKNQNICNSSDAWKFFNFKSLSCRHSKYRCFLSHFKEILTLCNKQTYIQLISDDDWSFAYRKVHNYFAIKVYSEWINPILAMLKFIRPITSTTGVLRTITYRQKSLSRHFQTVLPNLKPKKIRKSAFPKDYTPSHNIRNVS